MNIKQLHLGLFVVVFLVLPYSRVFSFESKSSTEVSTLVSSVPVLFTENKGQMTDVNHRPVPYVFFKTESPGMNMYVTETGLTYLFIKYEEEKVEAEGMERDEIEAEWKRVDMVLKGASITKENCIKEGESKNSFNYFLSNCPKGISGVHSYEKITFRDIYPGIDWVLYNSSKAGFKFDFIVHPDADPDQVKIIYQGFGKLDVSNDQIQFSNPLGQVHEGQLFCYQGNEKNEIRSEYKITPLSENASSEVQEGELNVFKKEISISVGKYNRNEILVIDPLLSWASFCGGSGLDGVSTLSTDPAGNIFIAGYIASTNLPVLNPGGSVYYQGTNAALRDCFVMKFSNSGVLLWSTYFGGSGYDEGEALCTDAAGNLFVTGNTNSTDIATLNPGGGAYFQVANAGSYDAFVLKFSNAGVLIWSTYYGGSGDDLGHSICMDPSGNVIVVGETKSANLPTFSPGGAGYYQTAPGSIFDGFILKFSNSGVQQWGSYVGGTGFDSGFGVCADASGNIFVTGATTSANFPTVNPGGTAFFQAAPVGPNYEMYITKYSPAAVPLWSTFYGGNGLEEGLAILNDQAGNVYVAGETSNSNFPTLNPGGGAYFQGTFGGGLSDIFLVKFSNTGTRLWATFFGGSGMENIDAHRSIAIDNCNNVYLSFNTESATMPVLAPCMAGHYFDNSYNGGRDIFLAKFSATGAQTWGSYFGGTGDDLREAIDLDASGNLFVSGEWTEQNGNVINPASYPLINPGGGAFYSGYIGGLDDSYVAKFDNVTVSSTVTSTPDACNCTGTATAAGSGGCSPYQYIWYNSGWTQVGNTPTISNLCGGTYHVIVRDSVNCTFPDTSTVVVTSTGGYVNMGQNISICTGSTYVLPGGNSVSTPGTYVDTLAIVAGCDTVFTTNLSVISSFASSQTVSICSGNSYTLPGGGVVSSAGVYSDTLAGAGGCDSIITTNVSVINAYTSVQNPVICAGAGYTLPGGTVVSVTGTYIDTLSSVGGCDSIITTNLSVVSTVLHTQNINLCNGNTFTLPDGSVVSAAGTYIDTLTAQGGCDSIITTNLAVLPNTSLTQNPVICSGSSYTLPGGSVVSVSGVYTYTFTAANGCDSVVTTNLTVNPSPNVSVTGTLNIYSGATTTLSASGGTSYLWTPAAGLNTSSGNTVIASPLQSTLYCVTVTNANGCADSACVLVTVVPEPVVCGEFYIPNAFSPNGDNENDFFKAYINPLCVVEFKLIVFNRWGESVFVTENPAEGWNGEVFDNSDKTSNTATYAFLCRAKFTNGKEVLRKGNVTLVR